MPHKKYLEIKIRDGQVYPSCFHEVETRACGIQISPSDIQAVVSNDIWTKYNTFKFKKETQHPGECPYCGFTQACEGPEHPEVTCGGCHLVYCYVHGRAHEGGNYADFKLKQSETEKLSRLVVGTSKPYPGCQYNVDKEGNGCNTLKYTKCETELCWICGRQIIDSSVHFARMSGNGCCGKQFSIDEEDTWLKRLMSIMVVLQPYTFYVVVVQLLGVPYSTLGLCLLACGLSIVSIFWLRAHPLEVFAWLHGKVMTYLLLRPISFVWHLIVNLAVSNGATRGDSERVD
ncbi:hypothetical protein Poli38472_002469 [Pythium oligandrum]|uniref:RING-type domain-containing protein n=1 Tax=Pythium oligandrum TaxID=41045 RepID=A0A8K1CID9_PYTOL|nr:hypothetical protein Poli38472_002469 [Pythium oligandrum]|eukprot:TMW63528.1 hypothetical protein Poli38472_002469 [Pythium oligandrum]